MRGLPDEPGVHQAHRRTADHVELRAHRDVGGDHQPRRDERHRARTDHARDVEAERHAAVPNPGGEPLGELRVHDPLHCRERDVEDQALVAAAWEHERGRQNHFGPDRRDPRVEAGIRGDDLVVAEVVEASEVNEGIALADAIGTDLSDDGIDRRDSLRGSGDRVGRDRLPRESLLVVRRAGRTGEGTLTVTNSTLSGNSAPYGGGIYNFGTLNLVNTLIANSPFGRDCGNGGIINTNDHNLIQGTSNNACGLTNGVNGSLIGVDPLLAPLGDYGGSTWTLALLPGSPAINAGNNSTCQATDQRGVTRPLSGGGTCDIVLFNEGAIVHTSVLPMGGNHLTNDVAVGLRYLQAWLTGNGAAGIYNLMEDVATAEIARSQVWQWIQRGRFTEAAVRGVMKEEVDRIRDEGGGDRRLEEAEALFSEVALGQNYVEFLTLPAYAVLE